MRQPGSGEVGVGSWIERQARNAPDRPALIYGSRSLTYAQLAERIRRLANGLRALGVGQGDRVAWLGPNHPAFLEAFFAVGQLGACLATVNHRLEPDEQTAILGLTEPIILIQHGSFGAVAPSVRERILVDGSLEPGIDFEALVVDSPDAPIAASVGLDDLLLLPHTSGTTNTPKVVMLTHGNVTWNAIDFLTVADFRSDDVTIAIAPFFRVGGTGVNVLPVMLVGGTVVVPDDPRPDALLGLLEAHRVTVGFGSPDLLRSLVQAERWPSVDLSSIRFVVTGGAPVPERLIRTYLERGVALLQGYGLSEAAPMVLLLSPDRALQKVGSAGRPPLFVDVRVVDAAGRDVGPGQAGELLARGPNVMAGYWRDVSATRSALDADGWLHTGDAARIDGDGDVWIVDRVEAGYTANGALVFPGDVERVLLAHPAVVDAGVVGIPTTTGEMASAAFIVRAPGVEVNVQELLAYCRDRLAAHAVPATLTFVDELPRNAVGKLVRHRLTALVVPEAASGLGG